MNEKHFLETMHLIDDDLLEEAYTPIKRKYPRSLFPIAIAACICLIVGLGVWKTLNINRTLTIVVSEYNFLMELPDNAKHVSHHVTENDSNMPMLEASFSVNENDYLCRMVNTAEPINLADSDGDIVNTMDWQTQDLSFHYQQLEEDSFWISWYDTEAETQWCLSGEDSISLLTTAETLVQKLGYSMAIAPDGAKDITYNAVYYKNLTIGETTFVWNDIKHTYRISSTIEIDEYFADISDFHLNGKEYNSEVLWCPARITIDADGQGKIVWFDIVPGLLYSLTIDKNASKESLLYMANILFEPAQEQIPIE